MDGILSLLAQNAAIQHWTSQMISKYEEHDLESILYGIREEDFVFVNKYKLWRLLGKGSGAAGTWKALLDVWQELDKNHKRNDLHGFENGSDYFIARIKTSPLVEWAGER